jgi:hypothetical protein
MHSGAGGITEDSGDRASSEDALSDRRVLDRIGNDLSRGFTKLDDEALHLRVPVAALAAALERAHGAVPVPPPSVHRSPARRTCRAGAEPRARMIQS